LAESEDVIMRIKKRKKSSRMHGRGAGSNGRGFRKKGKGKGHRGGMGMSGTGKRADQKKTLVTKLYGHKYFGKQGITSRGTKRDKRKRINLGTIQENLASYGKKKGEKWEVELKGYKILADGDVKDKIVIKAQEASNSAIEKVKKAGGEIILGKVEKEEKPSK
jgi:large subunit ribosomal protein L15